MKKLLSIVALIFASMFFLFNSSFAQGKSPFGLGDDAWKNDVHIFNPPTERGAWPQWQKALLEWQYSLETGKLQYGITRVWEWNESERYDGRVRFSMLKAGSDWAATGTRFYSTGGPQSPQYSAKYLFMYPGLDRVWTIGFRCAVDK